MSKVRITVTEGDIALGERQEAFSCPIARAMRRKYPDEQWRITERYAEGDHHYARLPQVATDFVRRFDRGRTVEPFEFDLDLIP